MHVTITRVEHIFLETYLLSWSCNKKFYGCNWLVHQRLNVTDMCDWNVIDLRKKKMVKSRDDLELYSWCLSNVEGVFACVASYKMFCNNTKAGTFSVQSGPHETLLLTQIVVYLKHLIK